jgi:hypothetical protein
MVEKAMAWIGFLGFICFAVWIIWFDRFLYRRRQKSNAIESAQVAQATSEALIRAGEDYLKAVEKRMDFHRQTGLAEDEAVKLTLTEVDAAFDRAVAKMGEEEREQHAKRSVSSGKRRVLLPLLREAWRADDSPDEAPRLREGLRNQD